MTLYKRKYRTESIRLRAWDYTTPWWYYVTINTQNHICHFGDVVNGRMLLNMKGKIVGIIWNEIPAKYPIVELDKYIIMPNYLHGIIIINSNIQTASNEIVETCRGKSLLEENERKFGKPEKNSLSMIVNHFKGSVTKSFEKNGFSNNKWQPRFFERIIRNEDELFRIRKYREQNPLRWEIEKNMPDNLEI
ncbi:MAG: transposase [bacterium]